MEIWGLLVGIAVLAGVVLAVAVVVTIVLVLMRRRREHGPVPNPLEHLEDR